jgi:hypothetical protein
VAVNVVVVANVWLLASVDIKVVVVSVVSVEVSVEV